MNQRNPGFDADDPRLTAYALGEADPATVAEIEALLTASPEARCFVEDVRETAKALTAGLSSEAAASPGLGAGRREAVEAGIAEAAEPGGAATPATGRPRRFVWHRVAVAAGIAVLAVGVAGTMLREFGTPVCGGAERQAPADRAHLEADVNELSRVASEAESKKVRILSVRDETRAKSTTGDVGAMNGAVAPPSADPGEVAMELQAAAAVAPSPAAESRPPATTLALTAVSAGKSSAKELGKTAKARPEADAKRPKQEEPSGAGLESPGVEAYAPLTENAFLRALDTPLSTFSIDVDTGAYANVRRFLAQGQRPPRDAVRIEELLNTFGYDDPPPTGDAPFSVNVQVARCPWKKSHSLVRIGLKGRTISDGERPPSNLVFLVDVSGSMQPENKLPLLKRSLRLLVDNLGENDRVAMVVYAGASGLVLPSTPCTHKGAILDALDGLQSGGSTNGGAGIQLAYDVAARNIIHGGTNRVILATDGDFNVGVTNQGDLFRLIEEKAKSGVFLTVLGYGMGNLKDGTLERLADKGNGHYAYIDGIEEARKVLVREMGGTLCTIAKDVKIQVEFNHARVARYRLLGYENRLLAKEDFHDDTKDAGEIGAGHGVTAFYEIVPRGAEDAEEGPAFDPLRYQDPPAPSAAAAQGELMIVKLRSKRPDADKSTLQEFPVTDPGVPFDRASPDFRFGAAVAAFGLLLRESPHRGDATFGMVLELATDALGTDPHGDRAGFIDLVRKAAALAVSQR